MSAEARRRRARRNVFRRALGAPRLELPSNCPNGKCKHGSLAHRIEPDGTMSPPAEVIACTVPDCGCREHV